MKNQSKILFAAPRLSIKIYHQTGLTLTELLVAMLLGVLILIAASSLFFSSHRTHRTTDAVSRIQEQQRLAFELMTRDIRNAGSFPCKEMNDPVWLIGYANGFDMPLPRYLLASGLIGNFDDSPEKSYVLNPDGTKTYFKARDRHRDGFDSLVVLFDPNINHLSNNIYQYPVVEHHRPDGPIKVLNLDKRKWSGYFIICNADTAIWFASGDISNDTIKITTGSIGKNGERGICGGGFTRKPYIFDGAGICGNKIVLGPSYCFWGDMTVIPTEEDKAACNEIGKSQAYIYDMVDLSNPFGLMWWVGNIDAEGRGDLFGSEYGKVAEGITSLQLRYRLKGTRQYIDTQTLIDSTAPYNSLHRKGGKGLIIDDIAVYSSGWSQVDSVHLKMTFQSKDNLGTDGKPIERTMETYIAIRSRMPDIYQ